MQIRLSFFKNYILYHIMCVKFCCENINRRIKLSESACKYGWMPVLDSDVDVKAWQIHLLYLAYCAANGIKGNKRVGNRKGSTGKTKVPKDLPTLLRCKSYQEASIAWLMTLSATKAFLVAEDEQSSEVVLYPAFSPTGTRGSEVDKGLLHQFSGSSSNRPEKVWN